MYFFTYLFTFITILYFAGCGSQKEHGLQQTTIEISSDQSTSNEINITKAKEAILKQADHVINIYEAKDKKSLFVYKMLPSYEKAYGLYEYDITVYPPVVRNEIISGYRAYVDYLIPLDDGKLVYQATIFKTRVVLYDYIRKKEIRKYYVGYIDRSKKIAVSEDENYLLIDKFTFDIHDIYKTYEKGDFVLDYDNHQLIDHTNNLIWEYQSTNQSDTNYTLAEAVNFCRAKGGSWHLPSMEEVIAFSNVNFGFFKNDLFDASPFKGYWIKPENILNNKSFITNDLGVLSFILKDTAEKNSVICVKKRNGD